MLEFIFMCRVQSSSASWCRSDTPAGLRNTSLEASDFNIVSQRLMILE
jgi:hypothetical protein